MATSDSIEKILLASAALDDPTHHYFKTAALTQRNEVPLLPMAASILVCLCKTIVFSQEAIIVLLAGLLSVTPGSELSVSGGGARFTVSVSGCMT